jgi:phosphatidylglycerophosphate synthase
VIPTRSPALLSARRRRLVYVLLGGLWLSGGAWLVLRYFLQRSGDFGPTPHPLTPIVLMIHGAFAMAALAVLGFVWGVHIVPAWRRGHRRATGITLVALFVALAATGYGLYYLGDEAWRATASVAHWVIGLAAIVPFVVHALTKVGTARRA